MSADTRPLGVLRRAPDGTFLAADQIVLFETESDWVILTFTLPCQRCHGGPVRERERCCPHCGGPNPWDDDE